MFLHEFAEDFVLAAELGFKGLDLGVLGVVGFFGVTAVGAFEGEMAVFADAITQRSNG